MKKLSFISALLVSAVCIPAVAQTDSLRQKIQQLIRTKQATVGVAVAGIESHDTLSINGGDRFPMLSVFKFHIALAVLQQIDKGKLSLTQKIHIKPTDLLPNTWSPIRKKYPNGNVDLSLAELLTYTVSESDNNGCDILLRLIGGPAAVERYVHELGVKHVAIKANEEAMHGPWTVQYTNWSTPVAAVDLLKIAYGQRVLSRKSHDFLWRIMTETSSGKQRLKGQLPTGTVVAHKTGTSDTNAQGVTAAINDIGIMTLPTGKHVAISVFVTDTKETMETNEKLIADIAKLTWDYFLRRTE